MIGNDKWKRQRIEGIPRKGMDAEKQQSRPSKGRRYKKPTGQIKVNREKIKLAQKKRGKNKSIGAWRKEEGTFNRKLLPQQGSSNAPEGMTAPAGGGWSWTG